MGPSEAADDRLGCFRPCRFYGSSDDHEIACVLQLIDSEKQAYAMAFQAHQLEVTENGVTQERRAIPYRNLGVGAIINVFQVTSLGQPMEVVKTHLAANRHDTLKDSVRKTWSCGGFTTFYQGLIPWVYVRLVLHMQT